MKKQMMIILVSAGFAVTVAMPRQAVAGGTPSFVHAIKAADATWQKAANAKDFNALAAVYGHGAKVMPPGHASVMGHDNIAAFWRAALKSVAKVELRYSEAHGMGSYAFTSGSFTMRGKKGKVLEAGKFVEIWHHDSAGWKLYRDIFNSNPPQSTAPASK